MWSAPLRRSKKRWSRNRPAPFSALLSVLRSTLRDRRVNGRHVSRRYRAHHSSGRQNRDGAVCWMWDAPVVAAWRPVVQRRVPEQPRLALAQDEDAIGQRGDLVTIEPLRSWRFEAVPMELGIHLVGGWERPRWIVARGAPAPPKALIVLIAALGAGTMARRQRGRLVEEKQPGEGVGRHDLTMPATKL